MGGGGGSPQSPGAAAAAGINADLANYPLSYLINAAATTGDKVNIGGKTYDFTGLGNADVAGKVSDQMAQTLLDIQKSDSADFINQRINELKASDPQGYAARQQLFDAIQKNASESPNRPIAQGLQDAITAQLNQGGQLDAKGREEVQEGVRGGQIRNGIILGNAPAEQEAAAMVSAGDNARNQRQQQATDFLSSGVSPEDVEYRRLQQAISDEGNFVNGQSPTAQFASLSSAGNGAVPIAGAPPNPAAFNPNAGAAGMNFGAGLYSGQVNWAANQVNPYIAGLSTLATAGNTLANANWSPWGNPTPASYASAASYPTGASNPYVPTNYYTNEEEWYGGGAPPTSTASPWDPGYEGPG